MKYDLADRTVAITGAAGGLGADLAKALRTQGARVALLDLNADAVRELADQLGSESGARGGGRGGEGGGGRGLAGRRTQLRRTRSGDDGGRGAFRFFGCRHCRRWN